MSVPRVHSVHRVHRLHSSVLSAHSSVIPAKGRVEEPAKSRSRRPDKSVRPTKGSDIGRPDTLVRPFSTRPKAGIQFARRKLDSRLRGNDDGRTAVAPNHSRFYFVLFILVLSLGMAPQFSLGQTRAPEAAAVGLITLEWTETPDAGISQTLQTIVSAPGDFSKTLHRALEELVGAGYRHAWIAPRDFSLRNDTLACVLRVTPGPRTWVRALEFTGLVHTDTVWLHRLVGIPLDVPLTAAWIDEVRQRLQGISCIRMTGAPEIVPALSATPDVDNAILRWHLTESRPVRLDGMVAAGGQASGGLSGRASVQMTGLLRRDRSVSVNYQRLQLANTQLNLTLAEAGAFGLPLAWRFDLDESHQIDQRQAVAANWQYGLSRTSRWHAEGELRWRKVTSGAIVSLPSRTTELSLGLSRQGRQNTSDIVFGTPARSGLMATFSHRRQFASATMARSESVDDRMMLRWELNHTLSFNPDLSGRLSAAGRMWLSGGGRLGPGDEWYLGGDELLRGYADREIAAASGSWVAIEMRDRLGASTALSLFAEGAVLRCFDETDGDSRQKTPYGYGVALWLISPDRIGRLEFAWRDHTGWRDGLVRLRITQNW